jgi:hypothetical protein
MYQDALAQSAKEAGKWPYDWVKSADYTPKAERATVAGQLVSSDSQAPRATLPNLLVGLIPIPAATLGRTTPNTTSFGRAARRTGALE